MSKDVRIGRMVVRVGNRNITLLWTIVPCWPAVDSSCYLKERETGRVNQSQVNYCSVLQENNKELLWHYFFSRV